MATKSPTLAERKAAAPAPAFGGNQSLSDVVRAAAGHTEAKRDVMAGVVYSAYFQALKHGNKSQLQGRESSLLEQAKVYSVQAKAKEAGFPQPKKAAEYYAAHLSALTIVGIPTKATAEELAQVTAEVMAEGMALAYIDCVDSYLSELAAMAAEKRAANKAAAPAKANKAAAEVVAQAKVDAYNDAAKTQANTVPVLALTLAEMVDAVAAALRTGTMEADAVDAIGAALSEYNELRVEADIAALLAGGVGVGVGVESSAPANVA